MHALVRPASKSSLAATQQRNAKPSRNVRARTSTHNSGPQLVFRVLPASAPAEVNLDSLEHAGPAKVEQIPDIVAPELPAAPPQSGPTVLDEAAVKSTAAGIDELLEASIRSELRELHIEYTPNDNSETTASPTKAASKHDTMMSTLGTKFSRLAKEQGQLQQHTAGLAKQLHSALADLEKLLEDRLVAEQQMMQHDLDLQQVAMQLELATAQRDTAVEQAHKLKSALQVWEGKNQRLAAQLRAARQDVRDLSDSRDKLEAGFLDLYHKREELQQRVMESERVAEVSRERVQQLQAQVSDLSDALNLQSQQADKLSTELHTTQSELAQTQAAQTQLGSLLQSADIDNAQLMQQLSEKARQVESVQAQLAQADSMRQQLLQQQGELQQRLSDLEASSSAQLQQLASELASSKQYTSRLRQQLQATTYQHDMISDSNHQLLQRLQQAEDQVKQLLKQAEASAAPAAPAPAPSAAAAAPAADVSSQSSASSAAVESLSTALHAVDQERKTLAITNKTLQQTANSLAGQTQELQAEKLQLQQQVDELRREQLTQAVNSWVAARQAVMAAYRSRGHKKHSTMALVEFANSNRFWVPPHLRARFLKAWMDREQRMLSADGFLGLGVHEEGSEVSVSSLWLSIACWEEWALSGDGRRSHLPDGVQQYVPAQGEGFPEDFVPFREYAKAVVARYTSGSSPSK